MAITGCLGEVPFQVSQEVLETIDNLEWSGSARYAVHQRHNQNALTEFTGLDPDKIRFTMFLCYDLGADVMGELEKLWKYERRGESVYLVLGDKCYGKCKWNVISHSVQARSYDRHGNLFSAQVSVELQEYLRK